MNDEMNRDDATGQDASAPDGQSHATGQRHYSQAPYGQSHDGHEPYRQESYGQTSYNDQSQPGYAQGYGAQHPPYGQGPGAAPAYAGYGYGGPGYGMTPPSTQPGTSVGPVGALKLFFKKYFQFHGRSRRSEYWWMAMWYTLLYVMFFLLFALVMVTMSEATATGSELSNGGAAMIMVLLLLLGVVFLGTVIPNIALTVRRLHDANLSGFFYFLSFIPYLGGFAVLVMAVLPSKPEGARFDDPTARPPQQTGADVHI
ncbi:DUF805 domain-containing protein [uncultured Micrococcus sp.]|uniref:DUF805 domain-containing protein n=1 Tax=uncultured Micrococcus sp. TaxID=114051 RepID=UPI00259339CF|nr:DUF805 domain-containing protein [uncultured Micrococcus sp.]